MSITGIAFVVTATAAVFLTGVLGSALITTGEVSAAIVISWVSTLISARTCWVLDARAVRAAHTAR